MGWARREVRKVLGGAPEPPRVRVNTVHDCIERPLEEAEIRCGSDQGQRRGCPRYWTSSCLPFYHHLILLYQRHELIAYTFDKGARGTVEPSRRRILDLTFLHFTEMPERQGDGFRDSTFKRRDSWYPSHSKKMYIRFNLLRLVRASTKTVRFAGKEISKEILF